jgi:hypothetical protein
LLQIDLNFWGLRFAVVIHATSQFPSSTLCHEFFHLAGISGQSTELFRIPQLEVDPGMISQNNQRNPSILRDVDFLIGDLLIQEMNTK